MSRLDDIMQDNDFTDLEKDIYSELENMASPALVIDYMNASRNIAKLVRSRMLDLVSQYEGYTNDADAVVAGLRKDINDL